jgi:hypothetical protein
VDHRSGEFPKLCVDCGSSKHTEVVEALNDELSEVIGKWDGDDDEVAKMRRLLAYAKRLRK